MKALHYELWFYDVWGNEEEGFWVNDRFCVDRDFIIMSNPKVYNKGTPRQFVDFAPTDKQILHALVDAGELKDIALEINIEIESDGENIYLTDVDMGYYPLCELLLKKE